MEISELLTFLSDNIATISSIPESQQVSAINRARRTICSHGILRGLYTFTMTQGTDTYAYTQISGVTVYSVEKVWLTINAIQIPLEKINKNKVFLKKFTSIPMQYYLYKSQVVYYPIPSAAYESTWQYTYYPFDLDTSTNTTDTIPDIYLNTIGFLACKYLAITDTNPQLAQYFDALYRESYAQLPKGDIT